MKNLSYRPFHFSSLLLLLFSVNCFSQMSETSEIHSPTPGSTLNSTNANFQWSRPTDSTWQDLIIGTTGPGSSDIRSSSIFMQSSMNISGLPNNGDTVYIRLFTWINNSWSHTDHTYTALTVTGPNPALAQIHSPAPDSTLNSTSVNFQWSRPTDSTWLDLTIGTEGPGSSDIRAPSYFMQSSMNISGLPNDGSTIYARLSTWNNGWTSMDYTYTGSSDGTTPLAEPVIPTDTPAIARDDLLLLEQGQSIEFDYLTFNDNAIDNGELVILSVSNPENGSLSKLDTNTYIYTPTSDFVGEDKFTYKVSDGQGGESEAAVTIAVNQAIHPEAVIDSLMSDVTSFAKHSRLGYMASFGPTAVNLTNYYNHQSPMAVAATMGAGRIIALPGASWASLDDMNGLPNLADMEKFYSNALTWLARSEEKDIQIMHDASANIDAWLSKMNYTNVITSDDIDNLENTDVYIARLRGDASDDEVNAIIEFIQAGGSVIVLDIGHAYEEFGNWGGWNNTIQSIGSNRLLRKAGIVFGVGLYDDPNNRGAELNKTDSIPVSSDDLVSLLKDPELPTDEKKQRLGASLSSVLIALPDNDTLLARLTRNIDQIIENTPYPTPTTPVTNEFDKAIILYETRLLNQPDLKGTIAHRGAEDVFGEIPDDAERLSNFPVVINGNWTGWQSTGMYAAPGNTVTVTVPEELVGNGYYVRLSGHHDSIIARKSWKRTPNAIQKSIELTTSTVSIASPYGGAIYIDLLDGADGKQRNTYGDLTIEVDGAIRAPYFVLGKNTNQEWTDEIRQYPAPYAELVTEHLAVSVPMELLKDAEDIESLLQYWDNFVSNHDWIGGTESYRTGPDRVNIDVQISNGGLHAGYPIQGPTSNPSSVDFFNLPLMQREGNWGFFHEVGHEMQRQPHLWDSGSDDNAFTFNNSIEVSVNIFSNAAMEKMAPLASKDSEWGYSVYHNLVFERAKETINEDSTFDDKDRVQLFFSLADGFGWDMYRKVLSSYVQDSLNDSSDYPTDEQTKKDQWLIRWSRFTGFDLTVYMRDLWRLEVSDETIAEVAGMQLPSWLPATTSIEHFKIEQGEERRLDFKNTGLSFSENTEFVGVKEGENHTLIHNSDDPDFDDYTYKPKPDFFGNDQIVVIYKSEAGNEVETTIFVQVSQKPGS